MFKLKTLLALCVAAMCLALVACGDDDDEGSGGGGGDTAAETSGGGGAEGADVSSLAGKIAIDGSSTVQPYAEAASELFAEEGAQTNITVGGAGTGDGFEKFCRGEIDIADASRPIEEDEIAACEKAGVEYVEVQVALDGLTVVTNKNLTIDCLTTDQLKQIFEPKSKVTKYNEVDPKLPDAEISLFTPGTESGTYDFFTDQINGEEGVQREQNVQTSADDNQIVTGVTGEDNAMGYFGFTFYEENQDNLNAVGVDGGDGCVKPSPQTIQDGTYTPLSRPLLMYASKKALARPEVKGFLEFAVNQHTTISEASKYVAMSDAQAEKSKQALASG